MKLLVKQLQGAECSIEVEPTTTVAEVKKEVAKNIGIAAERQKLILLGRALVDERTLQSYPSIKDGSKLILVVKKPESYSDVYTKYFKSIGLTDAQAASAGQRMEKLVEQKMYQMSWDDVTRLVISMMKEKHIQIRPQNQQVNDTDGEGSV